MGVDVEEYLALLRRPVRRLLDAGAVSLEMDARDAALRLGVRGDHQVSRDGTRTRAVDGDGVDLLLGGRTDLLDVGLDRNLLQLRLLLRPVGVEVLRLRLLERDLVDVRTSAAVEEDALVVVPALVARGGLAPLDPMPAATGDDMRLEPHEARALETRRHDAGFADHEPALALLHLAVVAGTLPADAVAVVRRHGVEPVGAEREDNRLADLVGDGVLLVGAALELHFVERSLPRERSRGQQADAGVDDPGSQFDSLHFVSPNMMARNAAISASVTPRRRTDATCRPCIRGTCRAEDPHR